MKVVMVNPPFYRLLGSGNRQVRLNCANLSAVLTLAGHEVYQYNVDWVPSGYMKSQKDIYDTPSAAFKRVAKNPKHPIWDEVRSVLSRISPDWVCVSIFSGCLEQAGRIAEIAKELGSKTACGGAHPTTVGNISMGGLVKLDGSLGISHKSLYLVGPWDSVCIGDGEEVINDIVEERRNGVIMSGNVKDLDSLPYPQRDNFIGPSGFKNSEIEHGSLLTSRGCRYRCSFCCQNLVAGESMRWHSVDYVMGQIRELVYCWGARGPEGSNGPIKLTFYDDVFSLAEKRVRRIMELIREEDLRLDFRIETRADCLSDETLRALKLAGCSEIKLGIESGIQRLLDNMNKKISVDTIRDCVDRIKRVGGIKIVGNFIVGYPSETDEEAKKTIEFARGLRLDRYSVSIYTAYAGTPDSDLYPSVGLDDPSELFHTNKSLLCFSTVKSETVDEFLSLNN